MELQSGNDLTNHKVKNAKISKTPIKVAVEKVYLVKEGKSRKYNNIWKNDMYEIETDVGVFIASMPRSVGGNNPFSQENLDWAYSPPIKCEEINWEMQVGKSLYVITSFNPTSAWKRIFYVKNFEETRLDKKNKQANSDSLVDDYVKNFYGYGSFDANFWFVGPEEAGGYDADEIKRRFSQWERGGKHHLEDCKEFYENVNQGKWHGPLGKHQRTWEMLIKIYVSYRKLNVDHLEFQKHSFCRLTSDQCCIDLSPIPKPNLNSKRWYYNDVANLEYLASLNSYNNYFEKTLKADRLKFIKNKITEKSPQFVIFYGATWLKNFNISNTNKNWKRTSYGGFFSKWGNTNILITKHPVKFMYGTESQSEKERLTNEYFDSVVNYMSSEVY